MDSIKSHGHVEVAVVAPDGTRSIVDSGHNTLLYGCADAVARLFAGEASYRPTTIGFVKAHDSGLGAAFDVTDGRKTKTQAELVGSALTVEDVPIESGYRFDATPPTSAEIAADPDATSHYSGNKVTFRAMTQDNTGSAYIYGFLLKDAAGRVLAVKKLTTAVQRTSSYAIAAAWTVEFD